MRKKSEAAMNRLSQLSDYNTNNKKYIERYALRNSLADKRKDIERVDHSRFHDYINIFGLDDRKPEWKIINPFGTPELTLLDKVKQANWPVILSNQIENDRERERQDSERRNYIAAITERNGFSGLNIEQCKLIIANELITEPPFRVIVIHHQYKDVVLPQIIDVINRPINNISSDSKFFSLRDMVNEVLKNTLLKRALITYCPYNNSHPALQRQLDTNVVLKALEVIPEDTDDFTYPWDNSVLDQRLVRKAN